MDGAFVGWEEYDEPKGNTGGITRRERQSDEDKHSEHSDRPRSNSSNSVIERIKRLFTIPHEGNISHFRLLLS